MVNKAEQEDLFRELTADVILDMRAQYLAGGGNAVTHWDRLTSCATSALKKRPTAAKWVTEMVRALRLGAPSSKLSASATTLEREVDLRGLSREWKGLMRSEMAMVIADARMEALARKEAREGEEAEHA